MISTREIKQKCQVNYNYNTYCKKWFSSQFRKFSPSDEFFSRLKFLKKYQKAFLSFKVQAVMPTLWAQIVEPSVQIGLWSGFSVQDFLGPRLLVQNLFGPMIGPDPRSGLLIRSMILISGPGTQGSLHHKNHSWRIYHIFDFFECKKCYINLSGLKSAISSTDFSRYNWESAVFMVNFAFWISTKAKYSSSWIIW